MYKYIQGYAKIQALCYKGDMISGRLEKFDLEKGSVISFYSDGGTRKVNIRLHHGPSNVFETCLGIETKEDTIALLKRVNKYWTKWVCAKNKGHDF